MRGRLPLGPGRRWAALAVLTSVLVGTGALATRAVQPDGDESRATGGSDASGETRGSGERTVVPPRGATVDCGLGTFGPGRWPTACWRPYGDDSPFNRPVPDDPRLLGTSQQIVEAMLGRGPVADLVVAPDTPDDWYHPVYYSQPGDPVYVVRCIRDWGTCDLEGIEVRIPSRARPAGGGDRHMAVLDQDAGIEYDFWEAGPLPPGGGTLWVGWGGLTDIRGDGLGAGATAAKFGLLAGVIRAPEMRAGRIDHALFMTVACTAPSFVYPAQGLAATCDDGAPAPAVGQHVWLDMSDDEIAALDVPGWKRTILRALATYGAFVGDTGGNEAFGLHLESGSTFTSFGVEDPMVEFARAQDAGVSHRDGRYHFDLGGGIDWAERLRVLDPCVGDGSC
ncbi:MAG TPA: hypothetical protein VFZ77_19975 [Acidimicrobiales bacterium]